MGEVFAFEVRCGGHSRIVNHHTRGRAIAEYMRDILDCWPDVKFTDFRARKVGAPHTPASFLRTAAYRGLPDIRCGQRVRCGAARGVIVGSNDSANFDVLFDDDSPEFAGLTLNCHPCDIKLVAAASIGKEGK